MVSLRVDAAPSAPALEYLVGASHGLDAADCGVEAVLRPLAEAVGRLPARAAAPVAAERPPAAARATAIAARPFADLSADPEQEHGSDGLAEEIPNLLAQAPDPRVSARTSAFAFRGRQQDIRAGACHVCEGGVRRAGDRLRVAAPLVGALRERPVGRARARR